MKLLFDANLSPKLVGCLSDLFPGSVHVFETGLAQNTSDEAIFDYALANDFAIVSADGDFLELAKSRTPSAKVIRLEKCDYRTTEVEAVLRRNAIAIAEMEGLTQAVLVLRRSEPRP